MKTEFQFFYRLASSEIMHLALSITKDFESIELFLNNVNRKFGSAHSDGYEFKLFYKTPTHKARVFNGTGVQMQVHPLLAKALGTEEDEWIEDSLTISNNYCDPILFANFPFNAAFVFKFGHPDNYKDVIVKKQTHSLIEFIEAVNKRFREEILEVKIDLYSVDEFQMRIRFENDNKNIFSNVLTIPEPLAKIFRFPTTINEGVFTSEFYTKPDELANIDPLMEFQITSRFTKLTEYIGLVDAKAITGDYKNSPYAFNHNDITSLSVYVDGESSYFKSHSFDIPNSVLLSGFDSLKRIGTVSGINRTDYLKGNFINVFDFLNSNKNGRFQSYTPGRISLEVKFSKQVENPLNIVIYGTFQSMIELDRDGICTIETL